MEQAREAEATPDARGGDGRSSFGDLLRRHRLAAGLTQASLAERARLSVEAISTLERGSRRRPTQATLELLAGALELSPAEREAFVACARQRDGRRSGASRRAFEEEHRYDLPIPPTPLVGREREVALACGLLRRPEVRLVTLTGTPGVGKTRLGLAIAEAMRSEFPGGALLVPLATLTDPNRVGSTIRQALGAREEAPRALVETLITHIGSRRLLLLLDNFEHVQPAAPLLALLLSRCAELHVLVTSRAALRIRGEHELPVPPLTLPDRAGPPAAEELTRVPAVALFLQRAEASAADFRLTDLNARTVAEICRKLDGLPLAIELAAAWIRLLTPEALLDRLDNRLQVLVGGALDLPERQRAMRDTLQWGHDLLEPDEQILFRRLSIFSGGVPLDAVEEVCQAAGPLAGDAIHSVITLVEKNWLAREPGDAEPRLAMLETVREYGRDRLDASGELGPTARAHADYYLALAGAAEPELTGADPAGWLARLEAEHDNFRAALSWAVDSGEIETGLELAVRLRSFWEMHGHPREGVEWFDALLGRAGAVNPALRAAARGAQRNSGSGEGSGRHRPQARRRR
jgi:predicted ATPase/transcriptional regulator with XRE-family HTH domain